MYSRDIFMCKFGATSREAEFLEEYVKECGVTEDVLIPLLLSNIRQLLNLVDSLFGKSHTVLDMKNDYSKFPDEIKNVYGQNYLLGALDMYGVQFP